MSISRQVFSSPFDITRGDECKRDRNVNGNIMSDTRVVRRSIFNTPKAAPNNPQDSQCHSNPSTIHFDRRLLGDNSMFANPIVRITGGGNEQVAALLERKKKGNLVVRTPPPVKGHRHVCIQADNESIDKFFDDDKLLSGSPS